MRVKSPCIEICRFDGKTGWCIACLRTRPECKDWNKMKDHRRHQILRDRSAREKKITEKGVTLYINLDT